jgi:hypothetical protein
MFSFSVSEHLIMTDDTTTQQQPCESDINRAWRYHENADTIFHSRLTSFVTSQSFLITGYMVSFYITDQKFPNWYSILIRLIVALLGMTYSVLFFLVCNWLYKGMQQLKLKYLAGTISDPQTGDPIYRAYYFHPHPDPVKGLRDEGRIGKIIPRILPWITFGFWSLLVILELFRIALNMLKSP